MSSTTSLVEKSLTEQRTPFSSRPKNGGGSYRILLPLERLGSYGPSHFQIAVLLARAYQGEILAIHVRTPDTPDPPRWQWEPSPEDIPEDIIYDVREVTAESLAEGIIATASEEKVDLILLQWRSPAQALRTRLSRLLDPVIEQAPCDVVLLRGEVAEVQKRQGKYRFMVAVGGGKNANAALSMAVSLARELEGKVSVVTVVGDSPTSEEEKAAQTLLDEALKGASVTAEERETLVQARIIRSDNVKGALKKAAKNHSIAFFGAPEMTILSQLLASTLVEGMMESAEEPMMVVRRYSVRAFWLRRVWRRLDRLIPNISAEERLDVYKRVRRGARANHDFYLLMLFSTIIATMGLLLNSGAVIIGAMLVAPLMTPMLGLALGMVMGDGRLLRVAAQSTASGVALAVGVAVFLTLFVSLPAFTDEIIGRTQPNLLDLTVGLAAGAAGAYGISRKSVAASLPGVAIAAALVPPLCVVGICLATARWEEAAGAMLLFTTNLIAISFSGAFIYMLLGFFPQASDEKGQFRLRTGLLVVLLFLFGISIPLTRSSIDQVFNRSFNRTVTQLFQEEDGLALLSMDWNKRRDGQPLRVELVLLQSGPMTPAVRQRIQDNVTAAAGGPVDLRLLIVPLHDLEDISAETEGE